MPVAEGCMLNLAIQCIGIASSQPAIACCVIDTPWILVIDSMLGHPA